MATGREYPFNDAFALPIDVQLDAEVNVNSREYAESALVEAAKANTEAFGCIYARYVGRVYSFMRARTSREDDAQDLTQKVFLQALAALPKYRERGLPFAAWLFRISRNVAHDFHRRRRTNFSVLSWEALPRALHPIDPHDYEEDVLREQERQEELNRIRLLIDRLDAEQHELIALRFFAKLTLSEIAKVVGKSQGTVQRQLVRVLQVLKEHYHEES